MTQEIEKSSFLTSSFCSCFFYQKSSIFQRLVTFIMCFISLSFRVIPEPLPVIYYLLNSSTYLFRKFFPKFLTKSVAFLGKLDKIFPKIAM